MCIALMRVIIMRLLHALLGAADDSSMQSNNIAREIDRVILQEQ